MKKNQNGFGILVVLVFIVAMSVVALTGWYVIKNNDTKGSTATNEKTEVTKKYVNQGPGMNPTLADGQEIYGKVIPASEVQRGDIIVFTPPTTLTERMVKRVVGLPGDTVTAENGTIIVTKANGSTYDPGLSGTGSTQKVTKLVTVDSFFVVGDNLSNSLDSRTFGLVPFTSLLSVIVL